MGLNVIRNLPSEKMVKWPKKFSIKMTELSNKIKTDETIGAVTIDCM